MKGARLHDALAKRRDDEAVRLEKMKTVDNYYDKWSKITSRYDQWTGPEYYRLADQNLRVSTENRKKTKALEERREKLKNLFEAENEQYAKEIEELQKPKMRQVSASVLKGINETYKRTEEEKRRLELESQLYKRWRNSPRADSVLLSSKSNNEALAKMNWLDKQIENQLERDKIEQQRDSDRLRLMEEFRKDDEILSSRKAERNEELTKLKTFQAQQMNELRTRENDSEHLHRTEAELTESNKQLRSELVNLDAHVNEHKERIQVSCDLRRIKMQLRNLSEAILRDLYYGNELLDRLTGHEATEEQQIQRVRNRFDEQIEGEIQIERQIECMYESEAKSFAMHQQAIWLKECETREQVLRGLINDQLQHNNNEIDFIGRRQHDLQEVRDCHRRAIDTTNDRIGALFGANTADENRCLQSAQSIRQSVTPHSNGSPNTNNLSADEIGLPDLFMESASIVGSPTRPQFGRKRVVWN